MALLLTSVFGVTGCGSDDDVEVESRVKNVAPGLDVSDAPSKADCDRLDRLDRRDLRERLDRLDLRDRLDPLRYLLDRLDLLDLLVDLDDLVDRLDQCAAASKSGADAPEGDDVDEG
jgi:hypothetical protein